MFFFNDGFDRLNCILFVSVFKGVDDLNNVLIFVIKKQLEELLLLNCSVLIEVVELKENGDFAFFVLRNEPIESQKKLLLTYRLVAVQIKQVEHPLNPVRIVELVCIEEQVELLSLQLLLLCSVLQVFVNSFEKLKLLKAHL